MGTIEKVIQTQKTMEVDFKAECSKIQQLFLRIRDCIKIDDASSRSTSFQKVMEEFFPDSSDCDYYIAVVEMFSQVSDVLSTPEAKKLYQDDKNKFSENELIKHPMYIALYNMSLQLEKENKYLKSNAGDISKIAELLAKSETERSQLMMQQQKAEATHKVEAEAQKRAIQETVQKIQILEEQINKLKATNAALSKKGKGQAEALNNEISKLQGEIRTKTEQMQMLEDQSRQANMIHNNEVNDLKAKLAVAQKANPTSGIISDEIALSNKLTANLVDSLNEKRKFLSNLLGPEKETKDLLNKVQNQVNSVKTEFETRKAQIETNKKTLEDKQKELENIQSMIDNMNSEAQDVQTKITETENRKEEIEKERETAEKNLADYKSKLEELDQSRAQKEEQLQNMKNEVEQNKNDAQSKIENVAKIDNAITTLNDSLKVQKEKINAATNEIEDLKSKENTIRDRVNDILKNLHQQLQESDS